MRRSISLLFSVALALAPSIAAAQVQQPPPVIERLEPTSGPPGTVVTMIGRFFRPDMQLRLGDVPVEVLTRLTTRWTFHIPPNATS
jgi:hypothetical protein